MQHIESTVLFTFPSLRGSTTVNQLIHQLKPWHNTRADPAENSHQPWKLCHGTVRNSMGLLGLGVWHCPGSAWCIGIFPTAPAPAPPQALDPSSGLQQVPQRDSVGTQNFPSSRADPLISACLRAGSQRSHLCLLCCAPI